MTLQLLKAMNYSLAQQGRILRHAERARARSIAKQREFREAIGDGADNDLTALAVAVGSEILDQQIAALDRDRASLHRGRTHTTRKTRRWFHLAHNFMRGTPYLNVEAKSWSPPSWDIVQTLVLMYAVSDNSNEIEQQEVLQRFAEWKDAAGEWKQPPPKEKLQRRSTWVRQNVEVWVPPDTDLSGGGFPNRVRMVAR